jgi:hypothetical protein
VRMRDTDSLRATESIDQGDGRGVSIAMQSHKTFPLGVQTSMRVDRSQTTAVCRCRSSKSYWRYVEMPAASAPPALSSLPAGRTYYRSSSQLRLSRRDILGVYWGAGRANERVHLALQNIRLLQLDYSLIPNRTRRAQARSWLTCSSARNGDSSRRTAEMYILF